MSQPDEIVIVRPGEGKHVGNVEFFALSEHTPRFNLGVITMQPNRDGPEIHSHADEDDSFYVLEGELTIITGEGEEISAREGTFVLAPPGVPHTFANRTGGRVRILNVHAPAGFDIRLRSDG
jgi:mannose-6-phosphate isomerase-like protein (cupin superfamily)